MKMIPVVYEKDSRFRFVHSKYIFLENLTFIGFSKYVNKDVYVVLQIEDFQFYLADESLEKRKIFSSITDAKNFLKQNYKIEF